MSGNTPSRQELLAPGSVRTLPGQNIRAARRADRMRREGVDEHRALTRNPVDVGRLNERMAGYADVAPAEIIYDDHDEVRRARIVG